MQDMVKNVICGFFLGSVEFICEQENWNEKVFNDKGLVLLWAGLSGQLFSSECQLGRGGRCCFKGGSGTQETGK